MVYPYLMTVAIISFKVLIYLKGISYFKQLLHDLLSYEIKIKTSFFQL